MRYLGLVLLFILVGCGSRELTEAERKKVAAAETLSKVFERVETAGKRAWEYHSKPHEWSFYSKHRGRESVYGKLEELTDTTVTIKLMVDPEFPDDEDDKKIAGQVWNVPREVVNVDYPWEWYESYRDREKGKKD